MAQWRFDHAGIRPLSQSEKSYGFMDLFWNWFGDSANASSWYFGGLLALAGLPVLLWNTFFLTPLIILPWATLAWISARTGATTVVLARPALGDREGTLFLGLAETFVQLGWTTVTTYIGALSLVHILHGSRESPNASPASMSMVVAILSIALVQGAVAAAGAGAIRKLKWVSSLLLILLGGVESVSLIRQFGIAPLLSPPPPSSAPFSPLRLFDISFVNIWTWLQVGDFGRFSKTEKGAFFGSWLGLWAGQAWFVMVGAMVVIGLGLATGHLDANDSDPSRLMERLGLSWVALSVIFLSCVSVSTSNLYGAGMGLLSLISAHKAPPPLKALAIVSVLQIGTAFIPLFFSSFIGFFTDFLTATGGLFIPLWSLVLAEAYLSFRKKKRRRDSSPEESVFWKPRKANLSGWLSLIAGAAFYYAAPHLWPALIEKTGLTIPAILLTVGAYLGLTRILEKSSPDAEKVT
ncbi:MAG: cytosine permease [Leptospirillia bacterium]